MSKVIYVDGDDEIADLINRLREAGDSDEVALVMSPEAQTLRNSVNLRLLKQFAQSHHRKTAIISGDPRQQQAARTVGLATYASVQAYERGIELAPPDQGVPASNHVGIPAPGGVGAPLQSRRFPPGTAARAEGAASPAVSAARTAPSASPGVSDRGASAPLRPAGRDRRRAYLYGALALGVVGLLLLLLVLPTATVTITLAADPVAKDATIEGSPDASGAGRPDTIVTTVVTGDQSGAFTATPTGTRVVPAVSATGSVELHSDLPVAFQFPVPKGEQFDTTSNPPIKFFAIRDTPVCVPGGSTAPCPLGSSASVPVQDGTPEAKGNVSADAIRSWPGNPCTTGIAPIPCSASDLTVSNPSATLGGADAKRLVIATQQDLDTFNSQVNQLKSQLMAKVKTDMAARQGKRVSAIDPTGAGESFSTAVTPSLPKPGDQYSPTQITIKAAGRRVTYLMDDVRAVILRDLGALVPQGDELNGDCAPGKPDVTQAGDDGTVILSVSAKCLAQPHIDTDALRSQFAGKSSSEVRRLAVTRVGSQLQDVTVDRKPFGFFILPLFSGRIEVRTRVVAKPGSGP